MHTAWIWCLGNTASVRQGQQTPLGVTCLQHRDPLPFFLFFSGAADARFDRWARPAPLKNKKKEGVAVPVL